MEFDDTLARAAIELELASYARHWNELQLIEVQDVYGPLSAESADIGELRRNGTCIRDVTLRGCTDCIKATWVGDAGEHIVEGTAVVISRTHPRIDRQRTCIVAKRDRHELEFRATVEDLEIAEGIWRLDAEANYAQYSLVNAAINCFTQVPPTSSPSALQVLVGSYFGDTKQRKAINTARARELPADSTALAGLNDAQKNAVQRSLTQRVLPLHGPPGTGKTQVVEAIFNVWKCVGVEGPMVGATPSNIAADNLANRFLDSLTLNVQRYGPLQQITQDGVRNISSHGMAMFRDCGDAPPSRHHRAIKRRRQLQMQLLADARNHVMIGTLDQVRNTRSAEHLWTTKLIVVDEANQATEPETIMPFQLADDDTHIVLIGDRMQLGPRVVSKLANSRGLGISMFERLIEEVNGIDACMLTVQYRMHESICHWPSQEFYVDRLFTDSSVRFRERVKGFPWPLDSALAFVDIQDEEQLSEVLAAVIVEDVLLGGSVQAEDIGVITLYHAETILIKSLLKELNLEDVEVGDINAFQGRQHEVIVLCLVRCNRERQFGYAAVRRANVALTRAKRGLIVVGDMEILKDGYEGAFRSFITNVCERDLVINMRAYQRAAAGLGFRPRTRQSWPRFSSTF